MVGVDAVCACGLTHKFSLVIVSLRGVESGILPVSDSLGNSIMDPKMLRQASTLMHIRPLPQAIQRPSAGERRRMSRRRRRTLVMSSGGGYPRARSGDKGR